MSKTTAEQRAKLRAAAEAAISTLPNHGEMIATEHGDILFADYDGGRYCGHADDMYVAQFFGACDPKMILALLDEVEGRP